MKKKLSLILPCLILFFCLIQCFIPHKGWTNTESTEKQTVTIDVNTTQAQENTPSVEPTTSSNDSLLRRFNQFMFSILFFDASFGSIHNEGQKDAVAIPFIILILLCGALFFTFYYRWMNIKGFKHAIEIVRGKYTNPTAQGEISHFRALTSALSATVGLGNIAGVAIAIQLGGPGAVFWMLLAAVFGMSSKFSSCTLAQMYRHINEDGSISGGPMYYLDYGMKAIGGIRKHIGKILAFIYAVMIMGGAIGGGNMFQSNQTFEAIAATFGSSEWLQAGSIQSWIFGIFLACLVALVVIGGIQRIGAATSKIVPAMCGIYIVASLFIIFSHYEEIPQALALIFHMAFHKNAAYGGAVGVMIWGIQRASFSNEAGLGSAAIVHAAAKTNEPVREGLVAMLEPFVDTILICLMTALVVIITGAWNDPSIPQKAGVTLTTQAFASSISWFPTLLTISIFLFAYSTMISWCYYGERGWCYILDHFNNAGLKTVIIFRIAFVIAVIVGAVHPLKDVLDFSDAMILSMAFPNILGSMMLAPRVLPVVKDYWKRYRREERSHKSEVRIGNNH